MSIINDMLRDLDAQRTSQAVVNDGVLVGLAAPADENSLTEKALLAMAAFSLLAVLAIFTRPLATSLLDWRSEMNNVDFPAAQDTSASRDLESARDSGQANNSVIQEPGSTVIDPQETYYIITGPADFVEDSETGAVDYDEAPATMPVESREDFILPDTAVDSAASVITHNFSTEERVQRNFQQALLAISDGDDGRAETLLGDTLSLDHSQHESRLLLANLQIRRQREHEAKTTLASGLAQYPGYAPYAMLYAQLLAGEMRFNEALQYLEDALPDAARDPAYHALLAGLYQRTGRALDAARHYQLALQFSPEKGEWWMGLGISLEQTGSRVNAYAAYRRALRYLQSPSLQEYVNARIRNLARTGGRE